MQQAIQENADKLCFFGVKGIRDDFRTNKEKNEFVIQFQMDCGFERISIFFRLSRDMDELKHFRDLVESKDKKFVACLDENLGSKIFEMLYSKCIKER